MVLLILLFVNMILQKYYEKKATCCFHQLQEYIDLHMHTTYSDGEKSPLEVLKIAEEQGLGVISITDHNSYGAHTELEKVDTPYYRYRTKTITEEKKEIITDKYYEENSLPSGYEKYIQSEKNEYSYKLSSCEK